jgi:hypothetical protein
MSGRVPAGDSQVSLRRRRVPPRTSLKRTGSRRYNSSLTSRFGIGRHAGDRRLLEPDALAVRLSYELLFTFSLTFATLQACLWRGYVRGLVVDRAYSRISKIRRS